MNSQEKLVVEDFDQKANAYAKSYSGGSSTAYSFITRRQRVCELLDEQKGRRVLDVGCGPGVMTEHLVNKGFEYFGVDISGKMIEECKSKYGHLKTARFSIGKIENLKFPDSFFDIIICMGVVEYIADDAIAVKEMARVLKPNGIAIITLPNKSSPYRIGERIMLNKKVMELVKKIIMHKKSATLVHREYKEKDYSCLLTSHRFTVLDVVYYNFNLLFFPFDRVFPALAVLISKRLEFLCRSKVRWLGTGFIVKAKKNG